MKLYEKVRACFSNVGFTDEIIGEDPKDDVPLLELIQATEFHLNNYDSVDAADYVIKTDNIAVADNDTNVCEERLLADLMTTGNWKTASGNALV